MTSYEEISLGANESPSKSSTIIKNPTRAFTKAVSQEEVSIIENLTFVGRMATNVEFEKIQNTTDCENGLSKIDPEVFEEAAGENLLDYYAEKLNKKRVFFKDLSSEEIMKWSPEMLTKPLLQSSNLVLDESIKLFKHLLSYMGDRTSSKNPIKHAINHLKLCLKYAGSLFDEAYIQVLKQMNDNPDSEKRLRAWNFLAILASSFAPDTKLYYCLLNFLRDEIKQNPDTEIVKRANYIIVRLFNSYNSRRKFMMSPEEIKYTEDMKPMQLKIYFFSGTYTSIPYESYSTLGEIKHSMMMKLKLKVSRIPYYALCEILEKNDSTEERLLEEEEKVVDTLAMCEYDLERFAKERVKAEFKIYLKILLHYGFTETDIDQVTLNFYQGLYDIIQGKFNLTDDDVGKLAALQLIAMYGTLSHEQAKDKLEKELRNFVPVAKIKKNQEHFWVKAIMDEYTKINYIDTKFDARKIYLDHIRRYNFYEAHLFWVKVQSEEVGEAVKKNDKRSDNSEYRWLALKPNGISICDANKEQLLFLEYVQIYHWGYNADTFVIVIQEDEKKYTKYYFETYQVRTIYVIVQSYCYLIAQWPLQDLMEHLKNYVTNFKNLPKTVTSKEKNVQGLRSLYVTVFKK